MKSAANGRVTTGEWIARAVATAGGAGYVPVAPGTAGTAVAVPLAWLLAGMPLWAYALVVGAVIVVGTACARVADASWGTHDSGRIVIDEVAGYLVTVALVPRANLVTLAAGFVVFRVLDVVKPPPAGWIDRELPGGLGVVLDDVVAGAYGALLLFAAARWLAAS